MNIFIFLFGIIITFFIVNIYKIFIKKSFWIKQPIMKIWTYTNDNNIITKKIINTKFIKLPDKKFYYLLEKNINFRITNFINNNFYSGAQFFEDYLKWYLKNNIISISNYTINNSKNIIGFISGIHTKFSFNKKNFDGYYVDFLCIHKKYRNIGLASNLISKLTHDANKYNKRVHIFKIDQKPLLYIKIFVKVKYYLINLKKIYNEKSIKIKNNIVICELNKKDINELYNFYNKYKKNFKLYQNYTLSEFIYKFQSYFFSKSYIIKKNDKIICLINFLIFFKNNIRTAEINYIFLDIKRIDLIDILLLFSKIFSDNTINYMYITNISNNSLIIDYLFTKDFITDLNILSYYYLYNYTFKDELKSNEILF